MASLSIQVFGRVQGVFFRAETQAIAKKLELTGWVRNKDMMVLLKFWHKVINPVWKS